MREEVTRVAVGELSEQLAEFINSLSLVVDGLPSECGAYDVEELTFSLSVNASGKISLVGELAAGVSSGITVKIRKKRPATPE